MFSGEYAGYVFAAYAATALILGALIWATLAANARARRELDQVDRRRDE